MDNRSALKNTLGSTEFKTFSKNDQTHSEASDTKRSEGVDKKTSMLKGLLSNLE